MRTRTLRFARLLVLSLPALAAAWPARGQPCTITCPPNQTVTARDLLAPVSFPVVAGGSCGIVCTPPVGAEFPLGTTTVTCTASNSSGGNSSCQFQVNVVPPTSANLSATDVGFINPNPGSSQSTGASFGQTDMFHSSTGVFNFYDEGAFTFAVPTQGFVAYNCAAIDDGWSCFGAKGSELNVAQIVLCGENQASVSFIKVPDQNFDVTGGVFFNGNSDVVCGATPGGKIFQFNSGRQDDPFFFGTMPTGSRVQEALPFGRGCAFLGTGRNGIFYHSRSEEPFFTDLSSQPDSVTTRRTGNLFVSFPSGKVVEIDRSGKEVASHDAPSRIFRTTMLPPDDVSSLVFPRIGLDWSPTFGNSLFHTILTSDNDVNDLKGAPGGATIFFMHDRIVVRTFPRKVTYQFSDNIRWERGAHRIRFGGEWCHPAVAGR